MAEVSKGYSLSNSHSFYKEKTGDKIDKALYRKICCDFNKAIVELALKNKPIRLPHFIGTIWVKKSKTNWEKPRVDLLESKLRGKVIYHDNTHSDGWWARWAWNKGTIKIANQLYYVFKPTRKNSRLLAAEMKKPDGYKKYFSQI